MAIYELRTYTFKPGRMAEGIELYLSEGWPVLSRRQDKVVGYFTGDVGTLNQVVHLWRYEDDSDRRAVRTAHASDADMVAFATKLRPMLRAQKNKLLLPAPWGPHP